MPYLFYKNESYKLCIENIDQINEQRIKNTINFKLPEIKQLQLTAVVDAKAKSDFAFEAGISYWLKTDSSNLLFDIAFADESPVFKNNLKRLHLDQKNITDLVISHLHPDHIGGVNASRKNLLNIPQIINNDQFSVYLPAAADVKNANKNIIYSPQLITKEIATTGPLRANLFFSGPTEEQSLVVKIKNKGLVIIVGCGHPNLEKTLKMAKKIGEDKIYAVIGGLHIPVKNGQVQKLGIDFQRIIGTGLRPWKKLTNNYLDKKILILEKNKVKKIFLSPHDSSDYALKYFKDNFKAEVKIIKSGFNCQI